MLADHILPVFLCTCFSFLLANNIDLCYTSYKSFEKEGSMLKKIFFFSNERVSFLSTLPNLSRFSVWRAYFFVVSTSSSSLSLASKIFAIISADASF